MVSIINNLLFLIGLDINQLERNQLTQSAVQMTLTYHFYPTFSVKLHSVLWITLKSSFHPTFCFSFDTRESTFPAGSHWSDDVILGRRAIFTPEPEVGIPYLTLFPVLKEDNDVFTCRLDYLDSPSTQVKVNLSVASKYIYNHLPIIYRHGFIEIHR